jgi:hypothetical protein
VRTYFRALQELNIEQRNASHDAIAALAAAGHVAALVTTNFDRLLERALDALMIPIRVYATTDDYRTLSTTIAAGDQTGIPVIKIHGSVHDAASLVDTLKQRRRGRGPPPREALAALLRRHYWLYLGFSASDLEYDPEYLGLRAAGDASPGFTFLHEPDRAPGKGALALQTAYGEKGRIVARLAGAALRDAAARARHRRTSTARRDHRRTCPGSRGHAGLGVRIASDGGG